MKIINRLDEYRESLRFGIIINKILKRLQYAFKSKFKNMSRRILGNNHAFRLRKTNVYFDQSQLVRIRFEPVFMMNTV